MKRIRQSLATLLAAVLIAGTVPLPAMAAERPEGPDPEIAVEDPMEAETIKAETIETESIEAEAIEAEASEDPSSFQEDDELRETEPLQTPAVETSGEPQSLETPAVGSSGEPQSMQTPAVETSGEPQSLETPAVGSSGEPQSLQTPAANAAAEIYTVTLKANAGGYFVDTAAGGTHTDTWTHTGDAGELIYNWSYEKPRGNAGKIFEGWSKTSTGSILPDAGMELNGNIILYAIWKQGCAVTLDADGGSFTENGAAVSKVVTTVEKGKKINTFSFGAIESPTSAGKRFLGYSLTRGGDLLPELGYEVTGNTLTLYAVWQTVCEITWHAAGGGYFTSLLDGTGQYDSYTEFLDKGEKVYNTGFINLVANEGNTLKGWSLTADGSQMISSSGYTVGSGSLVLYAVWEGGNIVPPETSENPDQPDQPVVCTVTFVANGGRFARAGRVYPTIKEAEVNQGTVISLYDTDLYGGSDPTRTGAEFVGWSLAENSTECVPQTQAAAFEVKNDITVYAVWDTTLTLNANGGTFADGGTTAVEKVRMTISTVVDLADYEKPSREGYTFLGWAENEEALEPMSAEASAAYEIGEENSNSEAFVYAVWRENSTGGGEGSGGTQPPEPEVPDQPVTCTVTFDGNGGYFNRAKTQTMLVRSVEKGTTLNLSEGDYEPGYYDDWEDFGGWSLTKTGTAITSNQYTVNGNVTLYAVWTGKIRDAEITLTPKNLLYTGKAQAPAVTVVYGEKGRKLVEGTDYRLTYTDNINVGTAKVVITGTGRFTGSVTKTFTIKPSAKSLKKPQNCGFVKWKNKSYTSCLIRWEKVEYADGYQTLLTWTDGSHASYTTVKAGTLEQTCAVLPNHVSQFKVRAYVDTDSGRQYGPWSNLTYITPSPTKLTVKKEGTTSSTRKAKISWNIIYGCNGYNVFVTTNPKGKWYWNQSTDIKAGSTSATITTYRGSRLKKGQRYYVRIVTRRKRNGVFCTVPMPTADTYVGSFKF